ncbi:MAG: HEAT repeat domain-containing protein [Vicinamibacterales bacterium]
MMKRVVMVAVIVLIVAAAGWEFWRMRHRAEVAAGPAATVAGAEWLDLLHSRNPRDVEKATQQVTSLGAAALPVIQATLRDPQAEAERLKASLKAVGILGQTAAPAIDEVAAVLDEPGLTAEAAIALSYMGPTALDPLEEALDDDDPVVRREALRSIGKLKERAPLEGRMVLPVLVECMTDPDPGVRAVAATYLGIIHEGASDAIPALIAGLNDADPEVRRASAAAIGSFGDAAAPALPALKKAASDQHDDVAQEAGQAIVKLQK